jgi:predicted transcriptional regulator
MTVRTLREVIQRADTWPEAAQEELAEIALEIEAELKGGDYHASPEELAGIDRGIRAADEGRFATDEEVDAVFAKHRRR